MGKKEKPMENGGIEKQTSSGKNKRIEKFLNGCSLVVGVTAAQSVGLLRGQLNFMKNKGFATTVVCSPGRVAREFSAQENVNLIEVSMEREIAPLKDLISLWRLYKIFREEAPTIVNAGTPKAGLLMMVAATMARVPYKIYTLRGIRFETTKGFKRSLLKFLERFTATLSHRVICVSPSLRKRAIELNIVSEQKAIVMGKGSSNGIDLEIFSPKSNSKADALELRRSLGIGEDDLVLGYAGRLVREKGINELIEAWSNLRNKYSSLHLLIVGSTHNLTDITRENLVVLKNDSRINLVGHIPKGERLVNYYICMDLFVVPTYREGFGNVLLEASALGIPVVSSNIPGCVDAVQNGKTGTLIEPKNVGLLIKTIEMYLNDDTLRFKHGNAGIVRAKTYFKQEDIWKSLYNIYIDLLSNQN